MITQTFDLNLIPDSAPVVVHCDQYDKGSGRLAASLYVGAVTYAPSGTAIIQGSKPDGRGFAYNASLSDNVVTANLTEQMTAVAGRVRCQIVVTEESGRTGTFVFILDVQKSALPADTDMSESEYQIVEQAIEEAEAAVATAAGYADNAEDSAEDAEAWSIGKRGGQDVPSTDPTYQNNSKYWAGVSQSYAQVSLHYKGSCLFANLPTTGMTDGDMWNIEDDFTTDSRFREGAGKSVVAGTNIAWIADISKWDVLAMPKISSLNDLTNVNITTPTDGQGLVFDSVSGEWVNGDVAVNDMTLITKGIGKPDGITIDVTSGTFRAKGVGIVGDVNSSGTEYGANWLYYHGTTDVITPDADSMYRVVVDNTASLYYWNGTAYVQLASAGGSGGASLIDVTTAQYNALPAADKNDPTKWYWINDMDGDAQSYVITGSLDDLTDVSIVNPQNGQILVYRNGQFVNENNSASALEGNVWIPQSNFTDYYSASSITKPQGDGQTVTLRMNASIFYDIVKFVINTATSYLDNEFYFYLNDVKKYIHPLTADSETTTITATLVDDVSDEINITTSTRIYMEQSIFNSTSGFCVGSVHVVGDKSTALGNNNISSGPSSFTSGSQNIASGYYSHAEGSNTAASGNYSHAEGYKATASFTYSHAEGQSTTASGQASHAEGYNTTASGNNSHAEGYSTTASNTYSHAEGQSTTASGQASHAEGKSTIASGQASHTEGYNTTASGNNSHAEGYSTKASSNYQHVSGKFNVEDSSNVYALIVGNGGSSNERSNALGLKWNGDLEIAGEFYDKDGKVKCTVEDIDDLSDVELGIPLSNGHVLTYDSTLGKWTNRNAGGGNVDADDVSYSNSTSGLMATDVQDAIDEIVEFSGITIYYGEYTDSNYVSPNATSDEYIPIPSSLNNYVPIAVGLTYFNTDLFMSAQTYSNGGGKNPWVSVHTFNPTSDPVQVGTIRFQLILAKRLAGLI